MFGFGGGGEPKAKDEAVAAAAVEPAAEEAPPPAKRPDSPVSPATATPTTPPSKEASPEKPAKPAFSMFGFGGGSKEEGGVAQRWNADKGTGLIKPDAGGADLPCPASSIEDGNALKEGEPVKFKRGKDEQGREIAEQVTGGISTSPVKARAGPSAAVAAVAKAIPKELNPFKGFKSVFGGVDLSDKGLEDAFKGLDTDGSGKCSNAELEAYIRKVHKKKLGPEAIASMMAEADTDKDGEVDLEEFKLIMRGAPKAEKLQAEMERAAAELNPGPAP